MPGRLFASFAHVAFSSSSSCSVRFTLSLSNNVDDVQMSSERFLEMNGGIQVRIGLVKISTIIRVLSDSTG